MSKIDLENYIKDENKRLDDESRRLLEILNSEDYVHPDTFDAADWELDQTEGQKKALFRLAEKFDIKI